ncbi:MAG TPA: Rid family hydrolase [Thermoanaerobaculia bacterium]|jgi:chorismate lyase/3-hydroxybenzoate synthase
MSAIAPTSTALLLPSYETAARELSVSFGQPVPGARVHVPLRQLGPAPLVEIWPSHPDVLFGSITAGGDEPLEELSRRFYAELIDRVRNEGFPYFLRMWNHVGGINEEDGGRERYKLFCAGRHDAFVSAGYHHDVDLPAASAVGMRGRGLVTYFLAAREPGEQIENPRQVAAYDYPPQYGPKSPSFSRATVWNGTVFVSGTSSVVGHATVHVGDVGQQLEETLRNIDVVVSRAIAGGGLANVVTAKTYIRHAEHYEPIARRLEGVFARNLFVEADICRADLLLEIEAVAR